MDLEIKTGIACKQNSKNDYHAKIFEVILPASDNQRVDHISV